MEKYNVLKGKRYRETERTTGINFINRFGKETYIDFLYLLRIVQLNHLRIKDIFQIKGIEYNDEMYRSINGVWGKANKYGYSVDNLIYFYYRYHSDQKTLWSLKYNDFY